MTRRPIGCPVTRRCRGTGADLRRRRKTGLAARWGFELGCWPDERAARLMGFSRAAEVSAWADSTKQDRAYPTAILRSTENPRR